jgi:hypothetical protein
VIQKWRQNLNRSWVAIRSAILNSLQEGDLILSPFELLERLKALHESLPVLSIDRLHGALKYVSRRLVILIGDNPQDNRHRGKQCHQP